VSAWEITTPLFGFTLSGTFGALNTSVCNRSGNDCERLDNILEDDYEVIGGWGGWLSFYGCADSCFDCSDPEDPIDLPPCTTDIFGNVTCPPGHPTYDGEQYSTRVAVRYKFWYSKMVSVTVEIRYVTPTTVKFFAYVRFTAGSTMSHSSRTQRRTRDVEYECGSNRIVSTGTASDPGVIVPPEPLEPCVSLLGDPITSGSCEDPIFTTEPDPCESDTTINVEYSCIEIVGGECVTVNRTASLVISSFRQCCGPFPVCPPTYPFSVDLIYESAEIACDEFSSPVTLNVAGPESDMTVSWLCDNVDPPPDLILTIPSSITLAVAI
jgi:hypothetical protein